MDTVYESSAGEEILRPINWNLLTADEAESEWLSLSAWVDWLRYAYGLQPAVVPPLWHRHDELIWELSALHTAWLNAYDPDSPPGAPLAWHREFAEARQRLRDWVTTCGTRIDRDRPTRRAAWPGEGTAATPVEQPIHNREADFERFVHEDLARRQQLEKEARSVADDLARNLVDRLGAPRNEHPQWRLGHE